jgi:hypothetical protein
MAIESAAIASGFSKVFMAFLRFVVVAVRRTPHLVGHRPHSTGFQPRPHWQIEVGCRISLCVGLAPVRVQARPLPASQHLLHRSRSVGVASTREVPLCGERFRYLPQ